MIRIYLSGPMMGYPNRNRAEFERVAFSLRTLGLDVVSPVETGLAAYGWEDCLEVPWEEHLKRDVASITTCDAIAMMTGWQASRGANLELYVARKLGLGVYDANVINRGGVDEIGTLRAMDEEEIMRAHRQREDVDDSARHLRIDDSARRHRIEQELAKSATTGRPPVIRSGDVGMANEMFEFFADNPNRQTQVTGGIKDDKGKSRLDLIPTAPLFLVGDILAFGALKYKPHNWRLGLKWSDTYASLQRHLMAWNDGEANDLETGKSHLGHALAQLMFLAEYEIKGTGINDLWVQPSAADTQPAESAQDTSMPADDDDSIYARDYRRLASDEEMQSFADAVKGLSDPKHDPRTCESCHVLGVWTDEDLFARTSGLERLQRSGVVKVPEDGLAHKVVMKVRGDGTYVVKLDGEIVGEG